MHSGAKVQSKATGLGVVLCGTGALWLLAGVLLVASSCGCITKTVAPGPIVDKTASYSETGKADSGMLEWYTNGSGVVCLEVTPSFRERYNAMIPIYGKAPAFLPPLAIDHGIRPHGSNYLITLDGLAKFMRMNRARKAGQ